MVDRFGEPPVLREVPDPVCPADGVVLAVEATGLCRSDWHAWRGHDDGVRLPHVPGHELAGVIVEVGSAVTRHAIGERVTVPFVCACGRCEACRSGDGQVCERQEQPGFTHWGSFAELTALHHADGNLVPVPASLPSEVAALLGCRFSTAYRAVVQQGGVTPGRWVAVHGCGGLGLSAVMIAAARGARVVAVDVDPAALDLATEVGAEAAIVARDEAQVVAAIRDLTDGGAHVSLETVGAPAAYRISLASLRRRGRHVQVGLLAPGASAPSLPLAAVVAGELELVGSHGMAARHFPAMLAEIEAGRLAPGVLIRRRISLADLPGAVQAMDGGSPLGVTVCLPATG